MSNKHGDFIWYELLTTDSDAAQKFYGEILGWQVAGSGQPGMDYRLASATDSETGEKHEVAGLMQLTSDMLEGGAQPAWLGYIGVDDVDKSAADIQAAGGNVHITPTDIPNVGRFAMVTDPQGVTFYVMRGAVDSTSMAFAFDRPRVGHCAWNELATTDSAAAWSFYGAQFGWAKDGEMDMGDMGAYEFIRHGNLIGAVMPKPPEMPVPAWSFYFRVSDIDKAVSQIKALGGQLALEPMEIPGGEFVISGFDPQGAAFCLIGTRKQAAS